MSCQWLKKLFKRGFFISIKRGWPGEGKLPPAKVNYKPVTLEGIRKEILKKKGEKDGSTR